MVKVLVVIHLMLFLLHHGYRRVQIDTTDTTVDNINLTTEEQYEMIRIEHGDALRIFRAGWDEILHAYLGNGGEMPTELSFYTLHLICEGMGDPWAFKYRSLRALWDDIIVKVGGNSADAYEFLPYIINDTTLVSS